MGHDGPAANGRRPCPSAGAGGGRAGARARIAAAVAATAAAQIRCDDGGETTGESPEVAPTTNEALLRQEKTRVRRRTERGYARRAYSEDYQRPWGYEQ